MNRLVRSFAVMAICAALPVSAEQRPVVVELYTSQGCSSCPPADEMLQELLRRTDVITIALHVDYWDYIGWKDEFGNPAHSERQRAYADAGRRNTVYTPEMIVNGQTDIVGAKPMALAEAIAEHKTRPRQAALTVARNGNRLHIAVQAEAALKGPFDVHVLGLTQSATTHITRGENRGKTIEYSNIAHGWKVVGQWDGQSPLDLDVGAPSDDPAVVLIQQAGAGAIIAAARVD